MGRRPHCSFYLNDKGFIWEHTHTNHRHLEIKYNENILELPEITANLFEECLYEHFLASPHFKNFEWMMMGVGFPSLTNLLIRWGTFCKNSPELYFQNDHIKN